ncbi:hypothetical protein Tco_0400105 [Tanacetum coccineum]
MQKLSWPINFLGAQSAQSSPFNSLANGSLKDCQRVLVVLWGGDKWGKGQVWLEVNSIRGLRGTGVYRVLAGMFVFDIAG